MKDDELGESIEEFDMPGEQRIEAPTNGEVEALADYFVHARELVKQITGSMLDGTLQDLERIQAVLDSNTVEPEATYSIEALGVAFGVVFLDQNEGFDWCMVEDDSGRTIAIQYQRASALIFPVDMIVKRVDAKDAFNVPKLYKGLCANIEEIIGEIAEV